MQLACAASTSRTQWKKERNKNLRWQKSNNSAYVLFFAGSVILVLQKAHSRQTEHSNGTRGTSILIEHPGGECSP